MNEWMAAASREAPIESYWQRPIVRVVFFWGAIVGLFFVSNIGIEHYRSAALKIFGVLQARRPNDPELSTLAPSEGAATILAQIVTPTLGLAYYCCLLILTLPLVRPTLEALKASVDRKLCFQALRIFAIFMLLVFSVMVQSNGRTFMKVSVDPFSQETGWESRRRLIPALAYLFQLKGIWYHVVAHSLAALLILAILIWARRAGVRLQTWQWIAILSSGWVIYQMQFPGYVDAAVYIVLLSSLFVPMSAYGRAACVALMLAAHEAIGLAACLPVILLVFPSRERGIHLSVIALYFTTWLANFGFDLNNAMGAQTQIDGASALGHLAASPWLLPVASVFAYKALWIFMAFTVIDFLRKGRISDAAFVIAAVMIPFGLLVLGVDASRLIGVGYLGALMSTIYASERWPRRRFNAVLIANLLLPSVPVFTHVGLRPSTSGLLYRVVAWLLGLRDTVM